MQTSEQPTAIWSFILPATALLATWLTLPGWYMYNSVGRLLGLAALDGAAAVVGLILVSRSRPRRGWAIAGAVTSVLLVLGALGMAALAWLTYALSDITF